jgi:hypothetical protein
MYPGAGYLKRIVARLPGLALGLPWSAVNLDAAELDIGWQQLDSLGLCKNQMWIRAILRRPS